MTQIPKIDDTPENRFKLALYLSLLHQGVDPQEANRIFGDSCLFAAHAAQVSHTCWLGILHRQAKARSVAGNDRLGKAQLVH